MNGYWNLVELYGLKTQRTTKNSLPGMQISKKVCHCAGLNEEYLCNGKFRKQTQLVGFSGNLTGDVCCP